MDRKTAEWNAILDRFDESFDGKKPPFESRGGMIYIWRENRISVRIGGGVILLHPGPAVLRSTKDKTAMRFAIFAEA